jgi:alkanesulfonate monooxygenase SsuD/methylene tetrahydromethanopterin reductase-like flavin-dependent oxidoreductase (luciferase family)
MTLVRISINVARYASPDATPVRGWLGEVARQADDAGVDTLWVPDHLLQMDPGADVSDPMLEAYTVLGFLGARTERVGLGTMVTWASMRPPALLVKAVTTLDVLTGGRAWLGIGAGYRDDEARMMGLPFEDTPTRFQLVEDTVRLAQRMWAGDENPVRVGARRAERPIGSPRPLRPPHPRILIGGMGERRTLPLVARYADACNLFDVPDEGRTLRRKLDVLTRACEAVGRAVSDIEITLSSRLDASEDSAALMRRCDTLAAIGVQHLVLITDGPWTPERIAVVGGALGSDD